MLEIGSLDLIRSKITTSPRNLTTLGLAPGSLTATLSLNGSFLVRALYYGFMGNVSTLFPSCSLLTLMVLTVTVGAGKTVLWCVNTSNSLLRFLMGAIVQFHDHRGHHRHA